MTLRQYHVLQYAEYLHSDPALWRITVDYMCACGEIGTRRADEVLLRVPLGFGTYFQPAGPDPSGKKSTANDDRAMDTEDEASRIRAGDIVGVLKEVNQCCFEHGREGVRRMVCRVCALKGGFASWVANVILRRSLARRSCRRSSTDSLYRSIPPPRTGPGWGELSIKS